MKSKNAIFSLSSQPSHCQTDWQSRNTHFSNLPISLAETLSSCMDLLDSHVTPPPTVSINNYPQTPYYPCFPTDSYTRRLYQNCTWRQISHPASLSTPDFPALYPRMPLALASPKLILNQSFPQPSPQFVLFPSCASQSPSGVLLPTNVRMTLTLRLTSHIACS